MQVMSKTDTRPTAAEAANYLVGAQHITILEEPAEHTALVQGIYGQTSADATWIAAQINGRTPDYQATARYRAGHGWHVKVSRYA